MELKNEGLGRYSAVETNGMDDNDKFVLSPLEHSSRGV